MVWEAVQVPSGVGGAAAAAAAGAALNRSWTFLGEAKTDEKLYVRFSPARQATP